MTKNEIKALVSLLDDPDQEVARHVEERLVQLGEEAIPSLEEVWEESLDPEAQTKIEDLIHQLQFDGLQARLRTWKETGGEDLLEGLWLVSSYQYPDVDYGAITRQMEQIYYEAWLHIKPDMHPYDQVKALNYVMFKVFKFSANGKNFHSPANSMLNIVLETKRGNPLTLCAIYMTIARKLELPIYGVNLPNIFVLTYKNPELKMQFYINVYNKGLILSKADLENYIYQLNLSPTDIFYEPCSNIDIIKRSLRNLGVSFEKLDEPEKAVEVTKLLEIVAEGDAPAEDDDTAADEDDEEDV
ncbi:MAG: hypothetical protein EOP49_43640 [Sphingobacteriales bacterium]|nr:MAG: hypothetical protein EOP49_43640 [Sphingobacteriales bacterium]